MALRHIAAADEPHEEDPLDAYSRVVTSVAEIDNQKLTLYPGNFSAFRMQKEANRKRQEEMYSREQREIARLKRAVQRFQILNKPNGDQEPAQGNVDAPTKAKLEEKYGS